MAPRNAARLKKLTAREPEKEKSISPAQRGAIIYPWKPAPGAGALAIERASSIRYRYVKRWVDILLSLALLILLFPLGAVIALLVAMTSPGPVFYREERIGRFSAPFRIIKFRSMYTTKKKHGVLDFSAAQRAHQGVSRTHKKSRDPRITPVGRVLRRLSLDELPQLWNVLRGDMSLVGPRPIVEAERSLLERNLPFYDLFWPGITGLWQVSGRSDVDRDRRAQLDREYTTHWSCLRDLAILARTIPAVLTMRGAY
jgi:lipopolysaccharide/colanic/teichoic acid biosynthesis glycosyltransferase